MSLRRQTIAARATEREHDRQTGQPRRTLAIARPASGGTAMAYARVLGAWNIIGNLYGCGYLSTPLTQVAQAWDPDGSLSGQAFERGIGVAEIYSPAYPLERVLIVNDATHSELPCDLRAYDPIWVLLAQALTLPVSGGGTVTAYPVRLGRLP